MQYRPLFSLASRLREKANTLITAELEKAGIHGIGPSHGDILTELFRQDGRSMCELASCIRRSKSTMTTLIGKLEAQHFVVKVQHPEDARGMLVFLTPEGRALRRVFDDVSSKLQQYIASRITMAEADMLEKLLRKMLED